MRAPAVLVIATGVVLAGCAPVSVYPAPVPLVATRAQQEECALIRGEIARQQYIAERSGVMTTLWVEASARLNAANVISALERRAFIAGCPA